MLKYWIVNIQQFTNKLTPVDNMIIHAILGKHKEMVNVKGNTISLKPSTWAACIIED